MLEEAKVVQNYFPTRIINDLVKLISSSNVRKLEYSLSDYHDAPEAVVDAQKFAEKESELKFNYSIIKWYKTEDPYESGAYQFHIDPPKFHSIPLFLCTLKGFAVLDYIDGSGQTRSIDCIANQVVFLQPEMKHRVTPPSGGTTERLFFFLGWDSQG